jgi:hypothetical protein
MYGEDERHMASAGYMGIKGARFNIYIIYLFNFNIYLFNL